MAGAQSSSVNALNTGARRLRNYNKGSDLEIVFTLIIDSSHVGLTFKPRVFTSGAGDLRQGNSRKDLAHRRVGRKLGRYWMER
jgi:hypothetical protein